MIRLALGISVLLAVSCSRSSDALSRQDQEKMFRDLFGFVPPKTVSEIQYQAIYNRNLMDGAWGRWMSFTYNEEVFAKILKAEGYRERPRHYWANLNAKVAPKWPQVDRNRVAIYFRSHDDTRQVEGYSFEEYIWHDTNSNRVYFHKHYWD